MLSLSDETDPAESPSAGGGPSPAGHLVIAHDGGTVSTSGEPLTFGRSSACDLCVGASDRSISRVAGSVSSRDDVWWLENRSASRPLYVVSPVGLRSVLPVGGEVAVRGTVRVQVIGQLTYELTVTAHSESDRDDVELLDEVHEAPTSMPVISPIERASLVALAEGYFLAHPRYDARPRTYAEAAARLGVPASTVRKRTEHVRQKLIDAGVLGADAADARQAVVEFAIGSGLIGPTDLGLLDGRDNDPRGS